VVVVVVVTWPPSSATQSESPAGSAAVRVRCSNSSGVRYPTRQASMIRRASARVTNHESFRHSSRNRPWKLSMWAFWTGLPGAMKLKGTLIRYRLSSSRP